MDGGAHWCSGFLSSRKPPCFSFFEAAFSTSLVLNLCVKYSSVELMVRDNLATTNSSKLNFPFGRQRLLRTTEWHSSLLCPGAAGNRKKCPRKQKRGKLAGALAQLKASRPPIPTLFNVRSLDNEVDSLRLRLSVSAEMRNCAVFCLTETWLNDNMMDSAFQIESLQFS